MTDIILTGVDPELCNQLQTQMQDADTALEIMPDPHQAIAWIEQNHAYSLAVVVGTRVDEPVRLTQQVNRFNRDTAVLILLDEVDYDRVTRAIQFTPFLGDRVTCHRGRDTPAIVQTLRGEVQRGRQRRQFRTTVAVMNEQLRTLSTHRVSAVQYLDRVLDYAPVGVVALDPGGQIVSCNLRAGEILGQREHQLLGTSLLQAFPEDERKRLDECLAQAHHADTRGLTEEFERRGIAGEVQYVSVTAAALALEREDRGTLVILQDITAHVINEQEREAALGLRNEFLSVAAHELKTPLTSIKGFVDLMGRQLQRSQWDQSRITRLHEQLLTQVDRLELLVGDLLDASRIQQGRLNLRPEPIDLADLAQQVLERFAEVPLVTPEHSLILEAPEPANGIWDPDRLDQVITNLVSNALKYSPEGGEVNVIVRGRDSEAELVVQDQGVGIDSELQSRLFLPFMRGNARGNVPGTGLGLHITLKIVEQHAGTISVDSTPGEGSTFVVRLPLQPPFTDQVVDGTENSEKR